MTEKYLNMTACLRQFSIQQVFVLKCLLDDYLAKYEWRTQDDPYRLVNYLHECCVDVLTDPEFQGERD